MFMHCLHMKTQGNIWINVVQKHLCFSFLLIGYLKSTFPFIDVAVFAAALQLAILDRTWNLNFRKGNFCPNDVQKQLIHDSLLLLFSILQKSLES